MAFSPSDQQARRYLAGLMRQAGLQVRTDAAGNLIGRTNGTQKLSPMGGVHADSVPEGGRYDGSVRVIAALEPAQILFETLYRLGTPLKLLSSPTKKAQ